VLQAPAGANAFDFGSVYPSLMPPTVLEPGAVCRVYTRSVVQSDDCVGAWRRPNAFPLWPTTGAAVVLRSSGPGDLQPHDLRDIWYYRP
jgi:hypothetical protein